MLGLTLGLVVLTLMVTACTKQRRTQESITFLPDSDPPTSYALPATEIPDDVRDSLHPWVAGFIGMTPEQATARLHERWASIESDALISLREVLAEFEVRELVDFRGGGLIYAVRTGADINTVGNSFFLPGPMDAEQLNSHLAACNLTEVQDLTEFFDNFGGLAEDKAVAGEFVYFQNPWETFTDSWDGTIEGFDEWQGSLMLYYARNGCVLLVRPDGHVAWWVIQESVVREIAESFPEFIRQFAEHRKIAWPFDPYGP